MQPEEIDERNAIRDERTLDAARRIIQSSGLLALTRDRIAKEAGLSAASVSNFARTRISNGTHRRESYRNRILSALMMHAIAHDDLPMLRVGIAGGFLKRDALPTHLQVALAP